MALLMSKFKAACRESLKFSPLTLAVGGLAILVITLTAQSWTSYIRWLELSKRGRWQAELPVDFSVQGTYRRSFTPIVSRGHTMRFTLCAPLVGNLAEYSGKDEFLPTEASQKFLTGREFSVLWRVTGEGKVVAEGTIGPSDLRAWAMRDHALYQHAVGLSELQAGKEYLLTAQVDRANAAVSGLNPTLRVHTWGSLKGHRLNILRPGHTLLFCLVGMVLLAVAYAQHAYDRRVVRQP
jgi:hypothetical protein